MANLYAPPQAEVRDIVDPGATVMAERGTRLGASILDGLIFGALVYLPFLVVGGVGAMAASASNEPASPGILGAGLVLAIVGFAVWAWFTVRSLLRNGQSIAKKMLGIKVVRRNGTAVSFGRLFWLRNVLVWALSLIPLFSFVDSLFIFGESRQCLHDRIADTVVLKA